MKKISLIKSKNGIWKAFNNVLTGNKYIVTLIDPHISNELEILLNGNWDGLIWIAKHTPKLRIWQRKLFLHLVMMGR